ncbi:50S ribosome-binding GTPase [Burkholderia multivorans]|nr:50S ribosome-binding GTPase [Burkholderia multivorans]
MASIANEQPVQGRIEVVQLFCYVMKHFNHNGDIPMLDSGANELREENQEQLINDIREKISKIRSYTPKVGVFGNSGIGKSSLCNALFGKDVAKISDVKAGTRKPQEILIGEHDGQGGIVLIDVPGIGEDPARHKEYTELYKSLAPELDLVMWLIKADDRNYASGLDAYAEVFGSEKSPPVIFVITQTDKTNPHQRWNQEAYEPGEKQIGNIAIKEREVSKHFDISARNIVSIAVDVEDEKLTGKTYNLQNLVDLVVEVLPNEKKFSFTREAKEENVSTEARKAAEKGIWDSVKEFAGEAWGAVKDKVVDILIASASKIISVAIDRIKSGKIW